MQPDERLLHDILGAWLIADEQQRQPEKSGGMGQEQGANELLSLCLLWVDHFKASQRHIHMTPAAAHC